MRKNKMMEYKCKATGQNTAWHMRVTTSDGHVINKKVYDATSIHLMKGLPTLEEVKETLKDNSETLKAVTEYGIKHKRQISTLKVKDMKDYVKNCMRFEDDLSVAKYKKTRNCLSNKEFLTIMKLSEPSVEGETITSTAKSVWDRDYLLPENILCDENL